MGLRIERIPTLSDNYTYLAICDETSHAAIVDAPEVDPVVERVAQTGAQVKLVLSTHHHPDHSMANPELAARYGVPVVGHVSDASRMPRAAARSRRFAWAPSPPRSAAIR